MKTRSSAGFSLSSKVEFARTWRFCACPPTWKARLAGRSRRAGDAQKNDRQKRKTRPGGQPDGSSYTGAWGGWALAPYTASMGRDNRSHICLSRQLRRTFKPIGVFFNFLAGVFWPKNYRAAGRLGSPAADLSDAMAAAAPFKALASTVSCRPLIISVAGPSETAATGAGGASAAAETAA
jgi:hypothetical protein